MLLHVEPGRVVDRAGRRLGRATAWAVPAAACSTILPRLAGWSDPLGNDEAGSALVGRAWLAGVGPGVDIYGPHWLDRPPLLPLLYGAADLLGGAFGVRLLGAMAAVVLVLLAAAVAGRLGGRAAALAAAGATACIASAPVLLADHTYGELLAAVPSTGAILLLLAAVGRRESEAASRRVRGLLVAGGAAAACAVLVKQSAIDGGVAGTAALAWLAWRAPVGSGRRTAIADFGAWLAGAALPTAAAGGWAATRPGGVGALLEAVVGFRVQVLSGTRSDLDEPLVATIGQLAPPLVASGLVVLVPLAILGAVRTPSGWRRVLVVGWLVGALIGVLGGGYYWPHYLIQLGAPCAVGAGLALCRVRPRSRWAVVGGLVVLATLGSLLRPLMPHAGRFDGDARQVGGFVANAARPGDELAVVWARPGVGYYSHLPVRSRYLWSAMQAARPRVRDELLADLEAREAPTWVVAWNTPDAYDLDPDGAVAAAVEANYRVVATVCGRQVLLRRGEFREVEDPRHVTSCDGPQVANFG